jgi:hypothetical protein
MSYQPIIIIGAPRSGTNMLRDVLCQFQKVGTWPCDEINYVWKHGNIGSETDEFSVDMVRPKVKEFIRKEFDNFASDNDLNFLVEKTCANSLRIPFIDQVIPEAKYIFIVRDGVDVVGSAAIRWKAKLDLFYIVKKVRYVPLLDIPYYALRYLGSRVYKFFSSEQRLSFWGPSYIGLYEDLKQHSLEEICALQWQRCVDLSEQAFYNMPENQVIKIKYEEFVNNPVEVLRQVLSQLGIQHTDDQLRESVIDVSAKSIGKGRQALNKVEIKAISELISDTLNRHDYKN